MKRMRLKPVLPLLVFSGFVFATNFGRPASADGAEPAFESQVAPILASRCVVCHNQKTPKGGLSLATRDAALAGGDSGKAIVPGQPDSGLLLDYISGADPEMPKEDDPLSADEVAAIRAWIAAGADWPANKTLTPVDA
ncbi:MAG: hypothetical protein KDA41_17030, partial [Planctomycetales bacterium]|nr:hypothetical protein [Planctomycetales bacterium]